MSDMNVHRRDAMPGSRLRALPAVIRNSLLASAGAILAHGALLEMAVAAPQGGNVVGGQGQISAPDATTTLVHQQSHSMVVNWQSFDVAKPETVQFNQPSSSSAVLNRVLNQSASQIHGAVRANGQVFILNGSGVVFGKDARVDVGGLFVSSLDITNSDFMEGRYSFKAADGQTAGTIVNRGLIQAARGGSVTLVGGQVANEGVIIADAGHVNLAAGRTATVDFDGDGLVRFQVDGEVLENVNGAAAAVSNSGEIHAEGGRVLLSARAASQVFDRAVNNSGLVRAGGIQKVGGKVTLTGLGGGVKNTGTVDASGTSGGEVRVTSDAVIEQFGTVRADGSSGDGGLVHLASLDTTLVGGDSVTSARSESAAGGRVQIEGTRVGLFDRAKVDVSGLSAGGTVLAGGGYKGKDAQVRNATATVMDSGVTIDADARGNGDGGTVILWADDVTRFLGAISARGGTAGGDGGFVETSGKNILQAWGTVDVATRAGASSGTWLLDPANIEIVNAAALTGTLDAGGNPFTATAADGTVSNGSINAALDAGAGVNVVITTNVDLGAGNQAGNITQAAGATISKTAGTDATLTLNAANTITLTETISSTSAALNVVLNANDVAQAAHDLDVGAGDVVINAAITTRGGTFTASGVNVSNTAAGTITTDAAAASGAAGGAMNIDATTGNVSLAGAISARGDGAGNGGQIDIDAGGAGTVAVAAIDASGGAGASTGGAINLNSGAGTGAVTLNGNLTSTGTSSGGAVSVMTPALLGGPVTVNTGAAGGDIVFSNTIDNAQALILSAGTGAVTLGGAVGSTPLTSLTISGNTASLQAVTTSGAQSYTGVTTTTLNGTLATSNDAIALGAVTLGSAVTLDTNATTNVADLTIGIVSGGNNALTLDTGNVAGADIATGALNAIGALSVINAGDVTFGGTVGAASLAQAAGAGTTTFNGVVTSAGAISIITNAITINEAMTAATNVTLTAVSNIDVTAPGAGNRDVTATTGNINVSSTAGTIFLRDTATPSRARLVATGSGTQQVNTSGTLVIENKDGTNAPQIVADVLVTSVAGNLFLGDDSGASTFDDATMDALLAGAGARLIFTSTGGDIIIDRASAFTGNLSLIANGQIDDAGVGLAFQNTAGTLNLTAGTTIGAGGDGLQIDVASLVVTSATTVTVTNAASAGNAVYDFGTTAPVGAVTLSQAANDVLLNTIDAGANTVMITSAAAILDNSGGEGAGNENIIGSSVTLNAVSGIGANSAAGDLDIIASSIGATNTTSGGIFIDSLGGTSAGVGAVNFTSVQAQTAGGVRLTAATATTLTDVDAANGTIDVDVTGANLIATAVDTGNNNQIDLTTVTSGNVALGLVNAGTGIVNIASAGSITDNDNAVANDVQGGTVNLSAVSGIGASGANASIEVIASILSASNTTSGGIFLNSLGGTTAGVGPVNFTSTQAGGAGNVELRAATAITLTDVDSAGSVFVNTTGGDIQIGDVDAVTTVQVDTDAGAIDDLQTDAVADISGASIELDATTGIGATRALELASGAIDIVNTVSGAVNVANTFAGATTVSNLQTVAAPVTFAHTGAGGVNFTAAVAGDAINLSSAGGGNLTVANSVTTGNSNNLLLTTTGGGNVNLTGTSSAAGAQAIIDSSGNIGGAGTITANTIDLDAVTGIATLNTATASLSANTTGGNINIANAATAPTTVSSLTTGIGAITFGQTGAQTLQVTTATTGAGPIAISNAGAQLDAQTVSAGGGNTATLTNTTAGGILVGNISAAGSTVQLNSAGAIDESAAAAAGANVTAGTLTVNAAGQTFQNVETAVSNAAFTSAATTVNNTGALVLQDSTVTGGFSLINSAGITLNQLTNAGQAAIITANTGNISDGNGGTLNIDAATISLTAITGSIGAGDAIETSVNAGGAPSLTLNTGGGVINVSDDTLANTSDVLLAGTAAGRSVTLAFTGGALNINGALGAANQNLSLLTTTGGIVDGGATLTANNLVLDVSAAAGAAIGTLADMIDTAVSGSLTATTDGGAGGVFINDTAGNLAIAGITAGTGAIALMSVGNVSQSGAITGATLNISTTIGAITLANAGNDVDTVELDATGAISFTDSDDLIVGAGEVSGNRVTLNAGGLLTLTGDVEGAGAGVTLIATGNLVATANIDGGTNAVVLNSGGTISQTGTINGGALTTTSTGGTTLGSANNVSGFAATTAGGGNVTLNNTRALALGAVNTGGGDLDVTNAGAVSVAGASTTGGGALTITTSAGAINGTGGSLNSGAGALSLVSASGIGTGGAVVSAGTGNVNLTTAGVGAAGNISLTDTSAGAFATSRLTTLATTGSSQTINLTDAVGINFDSNAPVAALSTDTLNFNGATTLNANLAIPAGSSVVINGTTTVGAGGANPAGAGSATFNGAVNSAQTFTVATGVANFSGDITMAGGTTLNLNSVDTNFTGNSKVVTDALNLGGGAGSVDGPGTMTILRASASAADTEIGGTDPLYGATNLAALGGINGTLNLGGSRTEPPSAAQLLNNVNVTGNLTTAGNIFIAGAGDITFDNTVAGQGRFETTSGTGTVTVAALGEADTQESGNIFDTANFLSIGTPARVAIVANTVELLAANQIGQADGTQGARVNIRASNVSFAQGVEGDAQVDNGILSPASSESVLDVLGTFQNAAGLAGLIAISNVTVTNAALQLLSTPKQAKGELGFIDEGVFLLPSAFSSPERALLMPLLGDADFPGDQRPQDPNDNPAWQSFFEDVVRPYVAARYPLSENASEDERAAVAAVITSEMDVIIAFYELVRDRERTQLALEEAAREAAPPVPGATGQDPDQEQTPSPPPLQQGAAPSSLEPGYVAQPWSRGGIGVEARGWSSRGGAWPVSITPG